MQENYPAHMVVSVASVETESQVISLPYRTYMQYAYDSERSPSQMMQLIFRLIPGIQHRGKQRRE